MMKCQISRHPEDIAFARANIPCQAACPVMTDIPGYIQAIYEGDYTQAYQINRRANILPGVLGRICTRPCQAACRHGEADLGMPVSICHLKRAAAQWKSASKRKKIKPLPRTGKSVGIVGAGPAGLAAADILARLGHAVIIYEACPKPGGMLTYGIPPFRLPRKLVADEIADILRPGIQIQCNTRVGKDISLPELQKIHDALLITTGCPLSKTAGVPGESLEGFSTGLDFLMKVHHGNPPPVGKRAVVFGGGFTAVDCVRTARRLGAKEVTLCIRRTEEKLPVSAEEIEETRREGIHIERLVTPVEILGHQQTAGVKFRRNKLVLQPGSRRETPVPMEGTDFVIEADTVIGAIGQEADKAWTNLNGGPPLVFDPQTGGNGVPGLFAAGDFVNGASNVVAAMGHARGVAIQIDTFLTGRKRFQTAVTITPAKDTPRRRMWDFIDPQPMPMRPWQKENREVEKGYTRAMACMEAKRCYLCSLKYEIDLAKCFLCRWCIEVCPRDCIQLTQAVEGKTEPARHWNEVDGIVIDNQRCIRCGLCLRVCPADCIRVFNITMTEHYEA